MHCCTRSRPNLVGACTPRNQCWSSQLSRLLSVASPHLSRNYSDSVGTVVGHRPRRGRRASSVDLLERLSRRRITCRILLRQISQAVRLLQVLPRAITTLLRRMKVHAACAQSKYTEQDSAPESCIRPTPAIDGWRVGHAAFSRSVAATVTGRADSAGVRRCRSTEASARIDCASSRATASSA